MDSTATRTPPRPPLRAGVDSRAASGESRGPGPRQESPEETLETLTRLAEDLRILARVRLEVLREHVLEVGARGRRALWMTVIGIAATVTAIVLLVRGASEGVARLFAAEHAWMADVATGAVVLAGVLVVHLAREALRRRRRVRSLKRELEPRS